MNRRQFIKISMAGSALAAMGLRFPNVYAAHGAAHRTLINVMLVGGADLRYLFAPNPELDPDYATVYGNARIDLYNYQTNSSDIAYNTYNDVWSALYTSPAETGLGFGFHNAAGWLRQQFDAGNVAIVCNVAGSENRRHDHSQLIVDSGDLNASQFAINRDGWGGRLAEAIGAANVVSFTNDVSVFCKGTSSANRNDHVIHARDSRNFALSNGDATASSWSSRMGRALNNYYKAKQIQTQALPAEWPYKKFIQHYQSIKAFGDPFVARLTEVAPSQPLALQNLYVDTATQPAVLYQPYFGKQCAGLYDGFIGADLFKLRVASLEYTGWDTHRTQKLYFDRNIADLFGTGGGLHTLTNELALLSADIVPNIVFVFSTDFGRQLKANGDHGTDHGTGNYTILVGESVNGGVYGQMFPRSEIADLGNGETLYDKQGSDIKGLTSFERVLAKACDWVEPGTGVEVFPNTARNDLNVYPDGPILESGVNLDGLFSVG